MVLVGVLGWIQWNCLIPPCFEALTIKVPTSAECQTANPFPAQGMIPLHGAALSQRPTAIAAIELLVEKGTDVNVKAEVRARLSRIHPFRFERGEHPKDERWRESFLFRSSPGT
jgi:hypothetical protein